MDEQDATQIASASILCREPNDAPTIISTSTTAEAKELLTTRQRQWKAIVDSDSQEMTSYERIEMEQDVQGKNRLAAIAPSVTTGMAVRNLRNEIKRRQELESTSSSASPSSSRPPIHRTILKRGNIVDDEDTLVRFVRADRLDATKAITRLLDYYSLLVELFGEDVALRRPILLDDLNREQKRLLESGWIQLLLARDTAGRRILAMDEVGLPSSAARSVTIINKVRKFGSLLTA
jgi:hypothetical protein